MTEDEAKTKWCPATGLRTLYDDAARRPENSGEAMNRCIASACMAWRVRAADVERRQTGLGRMPVEPYARYQREGWRQVPRPSDEDGLFYERTLSEATGYCGLAGKPA